MTRLYLLAFPLFILLQSCTTDAPPTTYNQTTSTIQPLSIGLDSMIKRGGGPCTADTNCMTVRTVWPVLKGGNPDIRDSINQAIYLAVIANLEYSPDAISPSIEAAADSLIEMYRVAYNELDHYGLGYSMEVEGTFEIMDSVGVLELSNYYFMGGAHGNYGTLYYNFDLRNGQVIEYENFVRDTSTFKSVTEDQLNKYLGASPLYQQYDLTIDELFWGDDFFLPANFKLGKDSLEFIYNPYEAAPYAVGQIEFKVPYSIYGQSINPKF